MTAAPRPPAWRRYLRFWGTDPARDLEDELRFHLAARYDEYVANGMSPDDARAEVSRRFGDLEQVRRTCTDIDTQWRRQRTMGEIFRSCIADLRYAVRQLRRNPSLSAVAILSFALGIGANTAIFSVVDAVLFRPLPFPAADRLVLVGEAVPRVADQNLGEIAAPEFYDYKRLDGAAFSRSAIYENASFTLSGGAPEAERVVGLRASTELFAVLGVSPAIGRGFAPADSDAGTPDVVVLSNALWQRRFGADPRALGSVVDLDGRPATIIGVMPPSFRFPLPGIGGEPADLIVAYKVTAAFERGRGNDFTTFLIARLAPGVTLENAQRAVATVAANIPRMHPGAYDGDWKMLADVFPLRDRAVRNVRRPLLIVLAAVGLVLLVACINVSSLLLARASARRREIAVREALGAPFSRMAFGFLAEALVLVGTGGALGVVGAVWGVRILAAHAPRRMLEGYQVSVDLRVLTVTGLIVVATAIAVSLIPAIGHWKRRALVPALHEDGPGRTAGVSRQRGRRLLVTAEVALALVLATLAGLMGRSFARARGIDPGFDPDHVIAFRVGLTSVRYPTPSRVRQFEQRVLEGIRELPGVTAVSATNQLPMEDPSFLAFTVEGTATVPSKIPIAAVEEVYPGYFEAMHIRLREGRLFTGSDVRGSLPAVIVNEALARRYFHSGNAIGRRLKRGSPPMGEWLTIVGVTADVREDGLDRPVRPAIYLPALQEDAHAGLGYVVRVQGDEGATMAAVQRTVRQLDPEVPLIGLRTLSDMVGVSVAGRLFNTALLTAFALLALSLAAVGVYGLVAYSVVQRTREIGVRMAIGATRGDVVQLVLGQAVRLAAVGVAFGLGGALLASRVVRTMLFEVSPFDPATFVGCALLLLGVAALASLLPAWRASRIDPQVAIRAD
jgi:putative ABC transport system permease protein